MYGVTESVKQIVGGSGQESTRPEQRVMKDAEEQVRYLINWISLFFLCSGLRNSRIY